MCRKTRRPLEEYEVDRLAVEAPQGVKLTSTNGQVVDFIDKIFPPSIIFL